MLTHPRSDIKTRVTSVHGILRKLMDGCIDVVENRATTLAFLRLDGGGWQEAAIEFAKICLSPESQMQIQVCALLFPFVL